MIYQRNNLFQFATNELSQDAIICWICNNINFKKENRNLYYLADELIHLFLGINTIPIKGTVKIFRQYKNIDVLLVINEKYGIIIEDKTYTSEHSQQISHYKQTLLHPVSEVEHISKGLPIFQDGDIRTVYLKTGFHYPYDRLVHADCTINGPQFYALLKKYQNHSEILDDYIEKLAADLRWYSQIESDYALDKIESVLNNHYGQYLLLKDLFGNMDAFSHGSSSGIPWSNHLIGVVPYASKNSVEQVSAIFCRIDKKGSTYYISLRQYDRALDKKDTVMINQKKNSFYKIRSLFEETCQKIGGLTNTDGSKKYKVGGNNGGYYESEFGIFSIGDEKNQVTLKEGIEFFQNFLPLFQTEMVNISYK